MKLHSADKLAIAITLLALSFMLLALMAKDAHSDPLLDDRTWMHTTASTAIGLSADAILTQTTLSRPARVLAASSACFAVGVGKELKDQANGGHVSGPDLLWDAVGCALGIAVVEGCIVCVDRNTINVAWRW